MFIFLAKILIYTAIVSHYTLIVLLYIPVEQIFSMYYIIHQSMILFI